MKRRGRGFLAGALALLLAGGSAAFAEPAVTTETDLADKSELVHVKAAADGTPEKITVETTLKNPGGSADIQDFTKLSDIRNTEGDEEFTLSEDGTLVWQNHGEDIQYEGTSTEQLPVSVNVSYTLDGQAVSGEELAGKSGRVKIRFDYTNHTGETGEGDNVVQTPFTALTALVLPDDSENVEVTNGAIVEFSGEKVILGYAFPGLSDSLRPGEYELTEEVEIPEYVEISFDAVDFSLDFTATIVTSGIFSELEDEDLDDAEEMADDVDDLSDATGKLADGAGELADGTDEMETYLKQYTEGAEALDEGIQTLSSGAKTLSGQTGTLTKGADALEEGIETLYDAVKDLKIPDEKEIEEEISDAAAELVKEIASLKKQLTQVEEALQEAENLEKDASAYQAGVEKAVKEANEVLDAVDGAAITAAVNKEARAQARKAVEDALRDSGLSEEEIEEAADAAEKSIDVSGSADAVDQAAEKAKKALAGIGELQVTEISVDTEGILTGLAEIQKQLTSLSEALESLDGLDETVSEAVTAVKELKQSLKDLKDGGTQLAEGVKAFAEGVGQISEGLETLGEGSSALAENGSALNQGMKALAGGTDEMQDALEEFDEEISSELADLAGNDFRNMVKRLRALQQADSEYTNFGGLAEGMKGSVSFLIETAEIKTE